MAHDPKKPNVTKQQKPDAKAQSAGQHDKSKLLDREKAPGTGILPEEDQPDVEGPGIGFLGGAVIFKSGLDVKGIKAAAAVWITGAFGLAIATSYW